MGIDESPFDDQPETPQFQRDGGIGVYPPPTPGTTDLDEPGMFSSNDGTVINWLGENFYKACGANVTTYVHPHSPDTYSSCVKRVGHYNDHEDYQGVVRPNILFDFSGLTVEQAVGQALGAASMCWEKIEDAGAFDSIKASHISEALLKRLDDERG